MYTKTRLFCLRAPPIANPRLSGSRNTGVLELSHPELPLHRHKRQEFAMDAEKLYNRPSCDATMQSLGHTLRLMRRLRQPAQRKVQHSMGSCRRFTTDIDN
ncbi:unnamed protein product, partial [Ectocarpus sp. 12 AP-2014]